MKRSEYGFTLVELSIVLVILGLLVGGVLSGQSLIRAAELRAVTTEYDKYIAAVQTFRDKYFAIPGDFNNATAFWGKDNTNCAGDTGTAATHGTCNGNGDGNIDVTPAMEDFQFWNQLALAGMIEGSYTGVHSDHMAVGGVNIPRSKMSNGGWDVQNRGSGFGGDSNQYAMDYGNFFEFGGLMTAIQPEAPVLKPEEAWNIDTKMDDGMPAQGRIVVLYWGACSSSANVSDYTGTYKLSNSSVACGLYFTKAF